MGKIVGLVFDQMEESATGAELYVCPHCEKEYKSEKALQAHCKKEHPEMFNEQ